MQPLVRQYERWAAEAVVARRRRRRMVLARPANVVVAVLVIMVCGSFFLRAVGVISRGSVGSCVRSGQPEMGAGAVWWSGRRSGSVRFEEALDRGRRYGPVTHLLSHPNGRSSNGTFGCRHDRTIPEPAEGAT